MTERDPSSEPIGWRGAVLAGLGYAVLSTLAFPPFGVWVLALGAPFPLLWAATRAGDRPKRTALWVALGTAPFWAYEHIWIADIAAIGFVPVVLVLCTYVWMLIWALARVHRRLPRVPITVTFPFVWAGWEVFRGQVAFNGYPWFLAAHPLIEGPRISLLFDWSLAGPSSFIGAYGVSLLVVALTGVVLGWRMGQKKSAGQTLAGLVLVWLLLGTSGAGAPTRTVRVAVVQTNVPQSVKGGWSPIDRVRTLDTLIGLSREAATQKPDLIVWPETMFPGLVLERAWVDEFDEHGIVWYFDGAADEVEAALAALEHIDGLRWERVRRGGEDAVLVEIGSFADAVTGTQDELGVPFIVGATGIDRYEINEDGTSEVEGLHNSAFLIDKGAVAAERYDKLHLTPFGEVMPYISAWPWLESKLLQIGVGASGMSFDLAAGDRAAGFTIRTEVGRVQVATPICFEATNPHVCRKLVYETNGGRTNLLIQLTNDGWFFGRDAARAQHAQAARWRCVELGVPLVRAANTGFSMVISANGRLVEPVHGAVTNRSAGILVGDVSFGETSTVYGLFGTGVSWVLFGGAVVLVGVSFVIGRRTPASGNE